MHTPRPVVPALVLVLGFVLSGCSPSALTFAIGECVNLPEGSEVDDYESVDCEEAHDAEVFALPQFPEGEDAEFPGQTALNEFSRDRCLEEFEPYVGATYEDSALFFTALTPSQESWTDATDREVVCLLVGEEENGGFAQITGSKEGTGE